MATLAIISSMFLTSAYAQETEDSQIFISGFNAYQLKDYPTSIARMNEVLQKYPDTSLRDMALFWLSRAYFKNGNEQDAARLMVQFSKEFPDNALRETVEEELSALIARYEKGEKLAAGPSVAPAKPLTTKAAEETAEKVEQEKLATLKADQEQAAAEAMRIAAIKKKQERTAAQKAEAFRSATEREEQEKVAATRKEAERLTALRKEEERKNLEAARLSALKQEEQRKSAEKAALEAEAARQAEAARLAAARQEQEKQAAVEAEKQRQDRAREEEKTRAAKMALREKAITQFKSVIEKYPYTTYAAAAAAKLKELGITVALPAEKPVQSENAQVLRLEVTRFAAFELNLSAKSKTYEVAKKIQIPFEIINRGNGNDSFVLESGFPAEFGASFTAVGAPDKKISQTQSLAPGQAFNGLLDLTIPPGSMDGLKIAHPVKAASLSMTDATQTRVVVLVAAAPMLRAVLKTEKTAPLPGEKLLYKIAVLNVGSTTADDVSLRLNIPHQLQLVGDESKGFRQETKETVVLDGLQIKSGENREIRLTLQLKPDALAGQELLIRAELQNKTLKTSAAFVSNTSLIQPQHNIVLKAATEQRTVIPGQKVQIPLTLTNTGNIRDKFAIVTAGKGIIGSTVFQDLNRDSIRQTNEPYVSEVGPLEPGEEVLIIMEIATPATASDGTGADSSIVFTSEGDRTRSATAAIKLAYSRPVLTMTLSGKDVQLKPGEIASFDLAIINRGSNLARVVELSSSWPEQLELVGAEPANSAVASGKVLWNFIELGAGEKRTIRVSFRVRAGIGVGTNIQVKNILKYEDQLGNRY
ncbi:MAG: hypothetical protein A2079_00520 [Geobacteraceae bacterium GWC2_48_7]|nr:MAG: hypothetical protein A2079_00520 [Geobacteraceae bacterium GWC2_48_7]